MKILFVNFLIIVAVASTTVLSCSNSNAADSITTASSIQFFQGSFADAVSLAKTKEKPLFVMVEASWCSVCKKVKNTVLPQKQLGAVFNDRFVNVMVDYDSEEGKSLREQYHINGTPTFLILNAGGEVINRASGFQNADNLIKLAANNNMKDKAACN